MNVENLPTEIFHTDCAWCNKRRDLNGKYVDSNSDTYPREKREVSHGICPDCELKYWAEMEEVGIK